MGSSGLLEEEQGWRRSDVGWMDESGRREGEEEQEGFMQRCLHGQAAGFFCVPLRRPMIQNKISK